MSHQFLGDVKEGSYCCVTVDANGADAIRLKRLGVCENRNVVVVSPGDPMILEVSGSRIGISCRLAKLVQVRSIESAQESSTSFK